ncbi:hypothetical protein F0562_015804 [Nyssa sinensis]|uniref:C2H2-type domain-containing protein n=1 Tax=Nyssa sinensis TaxID=561372 RepID=A0A5J4ZHW3_9ASTE|nr:hypothetical protein F0562_015804 [Nyssa sinensis]
MEKVERETHDFMNVESFSQLPFIRPAPVKEKGIRLFGREFGGDGAVTDDSESVEHNVCEEIVKDNDNGESSRKFECHYCCRNFPTSQALGGHQNAHKRERQHAKRAHLQSAAMVHGGLSDAHLYGLMNYRLGGSAPSPAVTYHSWNSNSTSGYATNTRFYGSHGSSYSHQPINGSPLALWRIPAVQNSPTSNPDRSMHPLPLFANDDLKPSPTLMGSSSSQSRYGYEPKPSVQDHILDEGNQNGDLHFICEGDMSGYFVGEDQGQGRAGSLLAS